MGVIPLAASNLLVFMTLEVTKYSSLDVFNHTTTIATTAATTSAAATATTTGATPLLLKY